MRYSCGTTTLKNVIISGFLFACIAFILGFLSFLNQVYAAARPPRDRVDAIVVFSGEPQRILVATNFLSKGFGKRLLIVGQDNRDVVDEMRIKNKPLFECCVLIDHRSRNTAEDALLARNLVLRTQSRSLILVTSAFHVPRAKKELRHLLPKTEITAYGISDAFYKFENIFQDQDVGPAFLSQYIKYIGSSIPISRRLVG